MRTPELMAEAGITLRQVDLGPGLWLEVTDEA